MIQKLSAFLMVVVCLHTNAVGQGNRFSVTIQDQDKQGSKQYNFPPGIPAIYVVDQEQNDPHLSLGFRNSFINSDGKTYVVDMRLNFDKAHEGKFIMQDPDPNGVKNFDIGLTYQITDKNGLLTDLLFGETTEDKGTAQITEYGTYVEGSFEARIKNTRGSSPQYYNVSGQFRVKRN